MGTDINIDNFIRVKTNGLPMGAWGIRPEDNDGAWDIFGTAQETEDPAAFITAFFKGPIPKKWYISPYYVHNMWERVGALFLGLREGYKFDTMTLKMAMNDLRVVGRDSEWLSSWSSPRGIKQSINGSFMILQRIVIGEKFPPNQGKPSKVGTGLGSVEADVGYPTR